MFKKPFSMQTKTELSLKVNEIEEILKKHIKDNIPDLADFKLELSPDYKRDSYDEYVFCGYKIICTKDTVVNK